MFRILFIMFCASSTLIGQYKFTSVIDIPATEIKSQDRTGTCWSFATTSFVESELIKNGMSNMDLSEMFIVRNIYKQKAINYVLRQGKANFSQGSLAHDQLNAFAQYGIVPDVVYEGKKIENKHDHSELEKALKGFLDGVIKNGKPSTKWLPAFEAILDVYLGEFPAMFDHDGKTYTPESFAQYLGLKRSDYVGITSFTHHPFGERFILEIPDNFSNGMYYNVKLEDLLLLTHDALQNGYTISWDGDVSEKSFSAREGVAFLPEEKFDKKMFDGPVKEVNVTQESRQANFYNFKTTDDHLMHIVGVSEDQKGNRYFKVKNSWGEISDHKGYLYMSEAYFLAKTVSVYVNKNAISSSYLAQK